MAKDRPGRRKFSVAAALLMLIVLLVMVWRHSAPAPDSTITPTVVTIAPAREPDAHETAAVTSTPAVEPKDAAKPGTTSIPRSRLALNRILAANTDLMPLLSSVLLDARRGNADAQYVAGAILQFCGDDPPSSTLEDKQQQIQRVLHSAAGNKTLQETALHGLQSCAAIWQASRDDIGYGNDWLLHAASSGQPLAMLDQATTVDPSVLQDRREDFLRQAIGSGNPDVMQALAGTALENFGDHSMQVIAAALMACEFGADCSRTSEQLQALVSDPNDGRHYVSVQDYAGQQLSSDDYAKAANFVADFADRARKQALGAKLLQDESGTFRLSVDPASASAR